MGKANAGPGEGEYAIPVDYLDALLSFAAENGVSRDQILENTQLPVSLMALDVKSSIGHRSYNTAVSNLLRATDDPLLAVKFARDLTLIGHGILGMAIKSSPTLREMFHLVQTYTYIRTGSSQRVTSVWDAEGLTMYLNSVDPDLDPEVDAFHSLSTLLFWSYSARRLTGSQFVDEVMTLQCSPVDSTDLSSVLPEGLVIIFDQTENSLRCPIEYLDSRILTQQSELYLQALSECERVLLKADKESSTISRVQSIFQVYQPNLPDAVHVAERLGISTATLKRRLSAEGTSFQVLKSAELFHQAKQLLSYSNTTLESIAAALNFSDASGFIKAFKRWSGMTPGEFRENGRDGSI